MRKARRLTPRFNGGIFEGIDVWPVSLIALRAASVGLLFCVLSFVVAGQTPEFDEPAPPPIKQISKGERSQLESQPDVKKRVELAFALMDGRMKKAEALNMNEEFDMMFLELGGFHGLMDNTLEFLKRENRQRGKALNFFKKYEMGLRAFTPRLELIRRDLPGRYSQYVKSLLKYLRDARSSAIEPFFGDTVVPNRKQ